MEHLPHGGWGAVATKQDLRQAVVELRGDMDVRFAEVRAQFAELRTELHRTLRLHVMAMTAMTITLIGLLGR